MAIKRVAWLGTSKLGLSLLQTFSTTQFDITVLLRRPLSTYPSSPLPSALPLFDLTQYSTHVGALSGQDAVAIVTQFASGSGLDKLQLALVDAAIEASVKFFIPSEWAPDTAATGVLIGAMTLPRTPVISMKRVVHSYLMARASEGKIAFATIHPGVILDICMLFSHLCSRLLAR